MQVSFNAVERIEEYTEISQEAPAIMIPRPPSNVCMHLSYSEKASVHNFLCQSSGHMRVSLRLGIFTQDMPMTSIPFCENYHLKLRLVKKSASLAELAVVNLL